MLPEIADDYKAGRVELPAFLTGKKQQPYAYKFESLMGSTLNSLVIPIQLDEDSFFWVESINGFVSFAGSPGGFFLPNADVTQSFKFLLENVSDSRRYSNDYVQIGDFMGFGPVPKYLDAPLIFAPRTNLNLYCQQSNFANNRVVTVSLIGRKIYGMTSEEFVQLRKRQYFQYVLPLPSDLSANSYAKQNTVDIYNDSSFVVRKMLACSVISALSSTSAASGASREVLFNLRSTSDNYSFFNQRLPVRLVCGMNVGQWLGGTTLPSYGIPNDYGPMLPFSLPVPLLLPFNTRLEGTFDNPSPVDFSAVTTYKPSIVLEGYKVLQ